MTHRIVGATLLALLLAGASPAFANTRLAAFAWSPAAGPVAGYAVFASSDGTYNELVASVAGASAVIQVASSTYVTIRVAAYDSAGRLGPLSDASLPVRMCPGDFDGDEIVGLADWQDARSCIGQLAQGFCAGADIDLDGVVGITDLHAVSIGAETCPPAPCMGDFDADGFIGLTDWTAARTCLGKTAIGICAQADFDGNGVIALFEVNTVARAIGSDACAL